MANIAKGFFISALIYGLLGMLLGLDMAIRQDHGQLPTHAHIMVIGWVSFAIFGFFYLLLGSAAPKLLARIHFWVAQVSLAGLVIGLWLFYSGKTQFEPIAALSSIGYALSFVVFAFVAITALRTAPALQE